jgi:hypothetical protein
MRRLVEIIASVAALAVGTAACAENATPLPTTEPTPPLACLPDLDGEITADELPVTIGAAATYYVSSGTRAVDLSLQNGGWDLSEESPDDDIVEIAPRALAGAWYAEDFASGEFVVEAAGGLDAVYHLDDLGLWLHGLASAEPDPPAGRTLLVYDAPVLVLRLPLRAGDAWTSSGTVSAGTLNGLGYVGTDTYEVAVTESGRLDLPYVRFTPALKVQQHVTVAPAAGGVTTSRRQTSFFFECFGEIARAEGRADEPAAEFTTAAALRRFAL